MLINLLARTSRKLCRPAKKEETILVTYHILIHNLKIGIWIQVAFNQPFTEGFREESGARILSGNTVCAKGQTSDQVIK